MERELDVVMSIRELFVDTVEGGRVQIGLSYQPGGRARRGGYMLADDDALSQGAGEWVARVRVLERELATLKEEVRRLRYQKVEYRIDQMHINSLEGVLNIGITTADAPDDLPELWRPKDVPSSAEVDARPRSDAGAAAESSRNTP